MQAYCRMPRLLNKYWENFVSQNRFFFIKSRPVKVFCFDRALDLYIPAVEIFLLLICKAINPYTPCKQLAAGDLPVDCIGNKMHPF